MRIPRSAIAGDVYSIADDALRHHAAIIHKVPESIRSLSPLVMADRYCGCCATHSECFSLSDNGTRRFLIHVVPGPASL